MRHLRIAQIVLPWIALPPMGYAGTERVVYHLTEELVKRGHQVTLFASGDSHTSARLESIVPTAMGLQGNVKVTLGASFLPLLHVSHAFEMASEFDIIHSHAQFLGLPFGAVCKTPSVHTFHRVFEFATDDEWQLVSHFGKKLNFTSISNSQRIDGVNFIDTVYNGVDTGIYTPLETHRSRDYLFWAGRVIEKKGPEDAIQVAKKLQMKLIMAGEITEKAYFQERILPHIDGDQIQLVEHSNRDDLISLYQRAKVTLVPTKWNEPFGLVPVESMACGTPAVSYDRGGVSETIAPETGYLVKQEEGIDGFAHRVGQICSLSPDQYANLCARARNHVLEHFSISSMTDGYERVYEKILSL